tara:strand:+ start:1142 stop:2146 length:1005 start_codon:yes stop_codon:yes gene_type:complete
MGVARKIGCGCLVVLLLLLAAAAGIWIWKPWTQIVPLEMVEPTAAQGERVDTGDVLGNFYPAKGASNGPGVLLIGGSEGGLGSDMTRLALALQDDGFSVLHQSYWRAPGQPDRIEDIPLETFQRGHSWLRARPEVDPARTAMIGWSRGTEATQLLAIRDPSIKAIVLGMPANAVWPGFSWDEPWKQFGSPWSWRGEALPSLDLSGIRTMGGNMDEAARKTAAREKQDPAAAIPIDEVGAPVLMICGQSDIVWPSCQMGRAIADRAAQAGKADVRLLAYPDAGHYAFGAPMSEDDEAFDKLDKLGGSAEGNADALRESYREIVAFLRDTTGGPEN